MCKVQRVCVAFRSVHRNLRKGLLTDGKANNTWALAKNHIRKTGEAAIPDPCVSPQCKATEPEGGHISALRNTQSYLRHFKIRNTNQD